MENANQRSLPRVWLFKRPRAYCCDVVKPHVCIIRFHKPLNHEDASLTTD